MLNYSQLKREINEKGTEEIKYKLYNSGMTNADLYQMYKDCQDFINKMKKIDKKRATLCNMILDLVYKNELYYKETNDKDILQKIHEDVLKRDTYLKAKGLDRFDVLIIREKE